MGIIEDIGSSIGSKVKSDITWKAGQAVSDAVSKGASKILRKGDNSGVRKCPKCKKQITDSALKFCPDCGTKLIVTCKECNVDYPVGTKFCTQCGKALK